MGHIPGNCAYYLITFGACMYTETDYSYDTNNANDTNDTDGTGTQDD
jgi:hypothetical protein